jgi:hypothetical protein
VVRVNDRGDRFAGQARDLRSGRPAVLVARSGVDQDQAVGPAITTLLSGLPMVVRMDPDRQVREPLRDQAGRAAAGLRRMNTRPRLRGSG